MLVADLMKSGSNPDFVKECSTLTQKARSKVGLSVQLHGTKY